MGKDRHRELELHIPKGTPTTIDSAFLCRLGGAYLHLLSRVADQQGKRLSFAGFRLEKGSTRAFFVTSDEEVAREAADEAAPYVSGDAEPPPGLEGDARAVSDILNSGLEPGLLTNVVIGPWKKALSPRPVEERVLSAEIVSIRATLLRVGGMTPAVRVSAASEESAFNLVLEKPDDAKRLGAHLYEAIDIVAKVRRNPEDKIVGGLLTEWEPLEEGSGVEAWRDWFVRSCPEWEDVDDVERELGRTPEDHERH